jgi:hypothetical protein
MRVEYLHLKTTVRETLICGQENSLVAPTLVQCAELICSHPEDGRGAKELCAHRTPKQVSSTINKRRPCRAKILRLTAVKQGLLPQVTTPPAMHAHNAAYTRSFQKLTLRVRSAVPLLECSFHTQEGERCDTLELMHPDWPCVIGAVDVRASASLSV